MLDRTRYPQHCREHLKILDLIGRRRNDEAAAALRRHLEGTMRNLRKIKALLDAKGTARLRSKDSHTSTARELLAGRSGSTGACRAVANDCFWSDLADSAQSRVRFAA